MFLELLTTALVWAAPELAGPAAERDVPLYVALPVRDMSGESDVARRVQADLVRALGDRGALFVPPAEMEAILLERRIRYTDSLARADARAIAERTGAHFLLTGALLDHAPSPEPGLTFSLRVVDLTSGDRAQSTLVSLRGDEFRGLLGLGHIHDEAELEQELIARLLDTFDEEAWPREAERDWSEVRRGRGAPMASLFVSQEYGPESIERIAILPLVNGTDRPEAGLVFSDVLSHVWFQLGGVPVVEVSELRAALLRARVRSMNDLGQAQLDEIGRDLGVSAFVVGRLDRYSRSVFVNEGQFPEIEATMRLLRVRDGHILAAVTARRRGDRYHTLLGLGVVRDLMRLAELTASEMVARVLRRGE